MLVPTHAGQLLDKAHGQLRVGVVCHQVAQGQAHVAVRGPEGQAANQVAHGGAHTLVTGVVDEGLVVPPGARGGAQGGGGVWGG